MKDLKIQNVDTFIVANPWKPWIFVKVDTNYGISGIAEATTHSKPGTLVTAIDEMDDYFIGANPFETEQLFLEMYRDEWYSKNFINTTVISAIDIACWDIKGKIQELPVYDLLGGPVQGTKLRCYANGWYTDTGGTPEGFAEAAKRVVSDGYDALKFDPFSNAWQRMDRSQLNHSIEIVSAVRDAVGPNVDLLIEGHGRFTAGMAVEIANRLEKFNPTFFEEPTPPDNVDVLRRVSEKSSIPIATGERLMTKFAFSELLENADIDVIQPDLVNTGGITEGKKIAALSEAQHVSIAPHNPQGPVATAVCAHFCASVPNFMIQEVFEDYDVGWKSDLLEEPLTIDDGELIVPEKPGLGVELNMDAIHQHEYEDNQVEILNLFEKEWETRAMNHR